MSDSLLKNLDSYIQKCFQDAFKSECRPYNEIDWAFEYILVKDKATGSVSMIPLIRCKYEKVRRRVTYRLSHNLKKNFGIDFSSNEIFMYIIYESGEIDPNHTAAMIETTLGKRYSISLLDDENARLQEIGGECIPAYRLEKLLFKYYNIDAQTFNKLDKRSPKTHLPKFFRKDWDKFKELYKETFDEYPGSAYEFTCSKGLKLL